MRWYHQPLKHQQKSRVVVWLCCSVAIALVVICLLQASGHLYKPLAVLGYMVGLGRPVPSIGLDTSGHAPRINKPLPLTSSSSSPLPPQPSSVLQPSPALTSSSSSPPPQPSSMLQPPPALTAFAHASSTNTVAVYGIHDTVDETPFQKLNQCVQRMLAGGAHAGAGRIEGVQRRRTDNRGSDTRRALEKSGEGRLEHHPKSGYGCEVAGIHRTNVTSFASPSERTFWLGPIATQPGQWVSGQSVPWYHPSHFASASASC